MPPSPTPETARHLHEKGLSLARIAYRLKVSERIVRALLVQAGVLRPVDPAERDRQQQLDLELRRATLRQIALWNRQRAARRWA